MGSNVIKGEFMLVDGIKMLVFFFFCIELYNKYEEFIVNDSYI